MNLSILNDFLCIDKVNKINEFMLLMQNQCFLMVSHFSC